MQSRRKPPRRILFALLLAALISAYYFVPRERGAETSPALPPSQSATTPSARPALAPDDLPGLLVAARAVASAPPSAELLAAFASRREIMARLVRDDPEAALAAALTPHEYASLPPELQALVERPLAGVGFYGVLAICTHDPLTGHSTACRIERHVFLDEREIPAAIYGARRDRLTEEEASLYGVELDGVLALHADDAVVFPAERMSDDHARSGHLALIHRGLTLFFADRASLDAHLARLPSP